MAIPKYQDDVKHKKKRTHWPSHCGVCRVDS